MTTAAATDTVNRRWFRRPRAIVLFVLCSVVILVLLGVGVFKSSGHVAFDQAAALGEAVTSDPAALYDQTLITAKAEALGATVSFSPDFAEDGQVVVHSWIPQASVCLYLPATVPWGIGVGDEPCEDGPRGGPAAFPADERAAFGISEPQSWADADNPLIAVGSGSQATGYGDVYVQHQGPNDDVAVAVTGFNKVTGEPGPKAYFEASVAVRCQPIEGCQYRELTQATSGRTSSRTFTPLTASLRVPEDTPAVRVAVRQCLDIKLMLGNDVCTDWNFVGPINVPDNPQVSGASE